MDIVRQLRREHRCDAVVDDLHERAAEEIENLRRVLGWVLLTAGDDDFEVMVSKSTMAQHQSVTLTRRDNPSGGFVVGAKPE